jgi:hypothetical protein
MTPEASMRRPAAAGVASVFIALLATSIWLWRDRANVSRERDILVWRFVDGCNMIHSSYGSAERIAAQLRDPQPAIVTDAQRSADSLASQHLGLHYWLFQCATDGDRASVLGAELSDALRRHRAEDIVRLAGELRVLVPLRSERTRSWLRDHPSR